MTDDDFDKIEDEDFAEEFDFIDEDSKGAKSSTESKSMPPKKSGPNFIALAAVIGVVVVGGYYGFNMMTKKPTTQAADADKQALPLPTPVDQTAQPAEMLPPPVQENGVDFNQTHPDANTSPALENALPQPQDKSFSQVQKDLRTPNPNAPKAAIPVEINATLDAISEEMTLNVNQIKHLETTITNLASTVEQLNKSISAMDNRVLGLTETVDGLAQDLNNVKRVMADEDMDLTTINNKVKKSSQSKVKPITTGVAEYSVHAIIPGRAWLKSNSGQILTVTEGDKLGDYGTVAVIDAANGLVRTSSGITFR